MKRIAIDMDEVLSHFSTSCLELFNKEFNKNYTTEDLQGKMLVDLDARFAEKMDHYLANESFFLELKVIKDSQEVIQKLSVHYDIYIVTAAMEFPVSLAPKYQWLKKNFGFLNENNFVFCGDKSIIHADYLIDDTPSNLATFKGKGMLFTAPHNRDVTGYTRLNNWQEVAECFL
ncbi:5' nucleotidase, NT5C type [Sporosarcina limicola]|uniref:5'(3')-deoxyribonucleotidase n=1 Tax=Sporosarcina limicola TaxID=34101 RepID=A0A927RFI8_9BACL|nr:5'-3'-deoxyribonucleotidase [Sporosarcina limicola]MBE1555557.1 5'(3')-deoxyribonucleotidase [Sporosarcina limicola]